MKKASGFPFPPGTPLIRKKKYIIYPSHREVCLMKKTLALILAALTLTALLLAGCGGQSAPETKEYKTIGELLALEDDFDELQTSAGEKCFVYAFKQGGVFYRAVAEYSKETFDALLALDFDDPEYDQKQEALLSPLKITTFENLSDTIPSEDELKAYVGKTAKDLLAGGWTPNGSYNLDESDVWMNFGVFSYSVKFEDKIPESKIDSFDPEEDIKDMVVKSVTLQGLGDATNLGED